MPASNFTPKPYLKFQTQYSFEEGTQEDPKWRFWFYRVAVPVYAKATVSGLGSLNARPLGISVYDIGFRIYDLGEFGLVYCGYIPYPQTLNPYKARKPRRRSIPPIFSFWKAFSVPWNLVRSSATFASGLYLDVIAFYLNGFHGVWVE